MNQKPKRIVRFGVDQEQLVRLYKLAPNTEVLETIIDCCGGLCAFAYSTTKPGIPYPEFWQEAFKDIDRAIQDFDPDKGKFSSWITFRFLKAGQSVRHRRIKQWKRFIPVGISLTDSASSSWSSPRDTDSPQEEIGSLTLESSPIYQSGNMIDPAKIHEDKDSFVTLTTMLKQNQLRFTTSPEADICQFVLDYLITNQEWPSVPVVTETFEGMGVGKVLASRLLVYLRHACMRTLEVKNRGDQSYEQ